MAQQEVRVTVTGNLVSDPELRFTAGGDPVVSIRTASTPRFKDQETGEWKDGEGTFLTASLFGPAAENVAESLQKGMAVVVIGRLAQRSYETREGEKRTVYEVKADEVMPSLRRATAKVSRVARSDGSGGGFGGDPWAATSPPAQPQSSGSGFGGGFGGDEPPF